jgi:hypothetical protein
MESTHAFRVTSALVDKETTMNRFDKPLAVMAGFLLIAAAVAKSAAAPAAPAPASCSTAPYREFNFWLGDWNVADPQGHREGTNDVTSIQGGCVLQEHWVDADGSTGTSFNIYDSAGKRWHQTWVDSHGGLLLLDGGIVDGAMVLSGSHLARTGKSVTDRITWTKIDGGKVRQVWDRSADGGKSWSNVFDGIYSPKTS